MKRYWMYFKYVLKHKWLCFLVGRKLNVPLWCLLLHDWDKFTLYVDTLCQNLS